MSTTTYQLAEMMAADDGKVWAEIGSLARDDYRAAAERVRASDLALESVERGGAAICSRCHWAEPVCRCEVPA